MKHITPAIGDVVAFYFYHRSLGDRIEYGKITDIIERYGYYNNGETKASALIKYTNVITGKIDHCDIAWIKCIIVKSKGISRPYNIYRGKEYISYDKNGFNFFYQLIDFVFSVYNGFIPVEIDAEKAYQLWVKDCKPGNLTSDNYYTFNFNYDVLKVNMKVFKKWAYRNIYKMMYNVKELHREATLRHIQDEEDAERYINKLYESELEGLHSKMM